MLLFFVVSWRNIQYGFKTKVKKVYFIYATENVYKSQNEKELATSIYLLNLHFFKNYYFFLFSSFPQRICFLISDVFSFSSNLSHPTSCLLRKQVVAPSTVLVLQSEWRSPNWFLTSSGISAYNKPEPLHCKTKVVIFLVISLCFNLCLRLLNWNNPVYF